MIILTIIALVTIVGTVAMGLYLDEIFEAIGKRRNMIMDKSSASKECNDKSKRRNAIMYKSPANKEYNDKIMVAIMAVFTISFFAVSAWLIKGVHETAERSESVWTTYEISDLKSVQEGYGRTVHTNYIAYLTAEDGSTYTTYIPDELYMAHHVGESVNIEYYTLTLATGKVEEYRTWDGYYLYGLSYPLDGVI